MRHLTRAFLLLCGFAAADAAAARACDAQFFMSGPGDTVPRIRVAVQGVWRFYRC